MYADDIVLLAPSHEKCQAMLNALEKWCSKWGMVVNLKKSQVLHVRNKQRPICSTPLTLNDTPLEYVSDYKYLGVWVNEFLNNTKTNNSLTAAANRSFGRIVNLFRKYKDMGYNSYTTLFTSLNLCACVLPPKHNSRGKRKLETSQN